METIQVNTQNTCNGNYWTCSTEVIFYWTQIVLLIFPDIFKIRFFLCFNVTITIFLPYNFHLHNEFNCLQIISISIIIELITYFLLTWSYFVDILRNSQSTVESFQGMFQIYFWFSFIIIQNTNSYISSFINEILTIFWLMQSFEVTVIKKCVVCITHIDRI